MARHNSVMLLGFMISKPKIIGDAYALAHICVGRSTRPAGDNRQEMRWDTPMIITRDKEMIKEIDTWDQYDIVQIKGVIAEESVNKVSNCSQCGAKNTKQGTMVYVYPIAAKKRDHLEDADACINYITENREFSNIAYVVGTVSTQPKKVRPKNSFAVTQYILALNRKFYIRSDNPDKKADYPWVKSYGKCGEEDMKHLVVGSTVLIDGFLQVRTVQQHAECDVCGAKYDWRDRVTELVPYDTEYLNNYILNPEEKKPETETEADNDFPDEII